jgi:hypothetical protein
MTERFRAKRAAPAATMATGAGGYLLKVITQHITPSKTRGEVGDWLL